MTNEKIIFVFDNLMAYIVKSVYVDVIDIARLTYKLSYDEVDDLISMLLNEDLWELQDEGSWKRYNEIFDYLIFLKAVKAFQD